MNKMSDLKENQSDHRTPYPIVNSILDAAAQILPQLGYSKSTTNHIAQKAGVSIGSLYYYFRSKDAIYQKLADQVLDSYIERLEKKIKDRPIEQLPQAMIDEIVDFTFENRQFLKTLFSMSAKLGKIEAVYDLRNNFAKNLADQVASQDPQKIFVLVNAINGVLDNYIFSNSCPLSQEEMKEALLKLCKP